MSQVAVRLSQDLLGALAPSRPCQSDDTLTLSAPGLPDAVLAFGRDCEPAQGSEAACSDVATGAVAPVHFGRPLSPRLVPVTVWGDELLAHDEGDAAAEWLSEALHKSVRLVRYIGGDCEGADGPPGIVAKGDCPPRRRAVDTAFAPGHETAFPDGFPLLLLLEETRHAVEVEAGVALPVDRFRPNLVATGGCGPYAEDTWSSFTVEAGPGAGAIGFTSVKPCSRCSVTQVDQASGVRGVEPMPALQRLRSGAALAAAGVLPPSLAGRGAREVFLGWNVVAHGEGVLCEGAALTVSRYR